MTYDFLGSPIKYVVKGLNDNNKIEKEIGLCESALHSFPDSSSIHLQLARLYRKQGKKDLAFQHYKKAVVYDPGNMWTLYHACAESFLNYIKEPGVFKHFEKLYRINRTPWGLYIVGNGYNYNGPHNSDNMLRYR